MVENIFRSILLLSIILFSGLLFSSHNLVVKAAKANGFNFKAGDILITKSTNPGLSGYGVAGHAAIVLPDGKNFVSIAGYGYTPAKHSISWWLNTQHYKTKVVRDYSSSQAKKAADYAKKYYVDGKYRLLPYGFRDPLTGHKALYCSKLVWQSYYFGAKKKYEVWANIGGGLFIAYGWGYPDIICPYDYTLSKEQKHNGFKTVKSFGW